MFVLVDNHGPFAHSLAQAFAQFGRETVVVQRDAPGFSALPDSATISLVCIAAGFGNFEEEKEIEQFLHRLPQSTPVLGIGFGALLMAHWANAALRRAERPVYGKQDSVTHTGSGIFTGVPQKTLVGRYDSILLDESEIPHELEITARSSAQDIMAFTWKNRPWAGVLFHPESVLTQDGLRLLANFPVALANGEALSYAAAGRKNARLGPLQISSVLEDLAQGKDLSEDVAAEAFSRLMDGGLTPTQAGAFLLGLRAKGESPVEVAEAVHAVLERAVPIPAVAGPVIDIVGTGGDSKFSFNCSTATGLILAGMGHKVLKHGNRSVSSKSGSADVLEKLGIPLDSKPENVPQKLEENKFVFLFAPQYHPSFRHIMSLRRELGVRTLFNILGPLVNPARPTHHLLGVPREDMLSLVAKTLALTGNATGAVVCGAGGYDELTPLGPASLVFVVGKQTFPAILDPAEYGFFPCEEQELAVDGPDDAARVLRDILHGTGPAPMRDMVALNLGLALYLLREEEHSIGKNGFDKKSMARFMDEARASVASGAGRRFASA